MTRLANGNALLEQILDLLVEARTREELRQAQAVWDCLGVWLINEAYTSHPITGYSIA